MTAIERSSDYRKFVQDGIDEIESVKSLPAINKNALKNEMVSYFGCVERISESKIKAGEHLSNVKKLAQAEGTFKDIIAKFPSIDEKKAYRAIALYERVQKLLSPRVVLLAPDDFGGVDPARPFGNYQDVIDIAAFKKCKTDADIMEEWERAQERKRENWGKRHQGTTKPKEIVLRTLYLDFRRRLRQAPPAQRVEVFETIVGMMLAEMGIRSGKKFKPIAIPSDYKPKRGRPRKKGKAA